MKILVAYASRHGSTKGIAEFIGEKLRERKIETDVLNVEAAGSLEGYDAFIVGSAAYMGRWLDPAKQFVAKNQAILSARPLWLFSSGPVGKEKKDPQGRDLLEMSKPAEFSELEALVKPRGFKVFFGALYGDKLTGFMGFGYRLAKKIKSARDNMPEGDFRDWKEIETWASGIAEEIEAAKQRS